MPKIPQISGQQAVAAFCKAGFFVIRINGSHHILKSDNCIHRLSIPVHAGKNIGKGLLSDQIKKAGLTLEEFLSFL